MKTVYVDGIKHRQPPIKYLKKEKRKKTTQCERDVIQVNASILPSRW